jgi:hypothetical protein
MKGSNMLKKRFAIMSVSAAIVGSIIAGSTIGANASERPVDKPAVAASSAAAPGDLAEDTGDTAAPGGVAEDTGGDVTTMAWMEDAKNACRDWSYALWRMTDNGFVWGFMVGGATVGTAWYASHARGKNKAFTARRHVGTMTTAAASAQMDSNLRIEIGDNARNIVINNIINSHNTFDSHNKNIKMSVWSGGKHLADINGDCS